QLPASMRWSESLDEKLRRLIEDHYPKQLTPADLADETFIQQAQVAERLVRQAILSCGPFN
ncbi:MAG: N-succinylarginine dihydrolase, partial [Pirellulales bacterium]|nr:N-succinylarginine dihydrolase [Pirellulales bacterium]